MDAQKLKFMMSVQLEIDKLEAKLGSNHQEVVSSKALFQKLSQTEIQKKKTDNNKSEYCDELIPILNNTEIIIDKVNRVTTKYDLIDSIIEKRASFFYKDFPTNNENLEKLKKELVKNLELFELNLKKEDHKLASKYLIVQMEGIVNRFEQELIFFEESNPTRQYSQINYIKTHNNGSKTMTLIAKCSSIQTLKNLGFVDIKKISIVNDIRNYESHQYSPEQIIVSEEKLTKLSNSPSIHYESVLNFIKKCLPLIQCF